MHVQCSNPNEFATLSAGAPFPIPEKQPTFEFRSISESTVLKHLLKLPITKSSACRIITNRVLRETAVFIAASLSYLFNLSLNTQTFPNEWKIARVTPIFKQRGKPQNPTNYRPISLLPAVGKVMEDLQTCALLKYLVKQKLINDPATGLANRHLNKSA